MGPAGSAVGRRVRPHAQGIAPTPWGPTGCSSAPASTARLLVGVTGDREPTGLL